MPTTSSIRLPNSTVRFLATRFSLWRTFFSVSRFFVYPLIILTTLLANASHPLIVHSLFIKYTISDMFTRENQSPFQFSPLSAPYTYVQHPLFWHGCQAPALRM